METQSTYMNLPIMKHFSEGEISNKVDKFRKGEKGLFWFLKLGALIGLGYLTWVYVLPPLFLAIGQFLAVEYSLVQYGCANDKVQYRQNKVTFVDRGYRLSSNSQYLKYRCLPVLCM